MSNLKIRFFSDSFKSKRASHRLRGDVVSQALRELGYDAKVVRDFSDVDSNTIVIFLKRSLPPSIQRAKDLGAKTVYDLCENKFDEKEEYGPNCALVDVVSVNSEQMAISTKNYTGKDSILMPDPFERPILAPRFRPGKTLNILWFGSQSSFKFLPLIEVWQRLEKEIGNYTYHMIMSKPQRLLGKMLKRQSKGEIKGINLDKVKMYDWSWELQGQLLNDCDLVLMPVITENYRTDTKSANRVIDSLISGRYVITSPLASYLEFADYTWQDPDYIAGIKHALDNPSLILSKIKEGQKHTLENFSPKKLSKAWIEEIIAKVGL